MCLCGAVWCCVVMCGEKYKKRKKHWETCQNTDSTFGTMWSTMDRKKGQKTVFFPDALFLRFSRVLQTFSDMGSHSRRPKKALFYPKSCSKSPNHALDKVLTNETPGILTSATIAQVPSCPGCELSCDFSSTASH